MAVKENQLTAKNRERCVTALIFCLLMIVVVFNGVTYGIIQPVTVNEGDNGYRFFRYFTVISNCIVFVAALLCIPFEIDGLRNRNYHLPRWIVNLLYVGVTCTTITLFIVLAVLGPLSDFDHLLFRGSNLYLHSICPTLALILFVFINDDHNIDVKYVPLAIVPMLLYGVFYVLNVFILKTWQDVYNLNTYMPYPVSMTLFLLAGTLVAIILRKIHNRRHDRRKEEFRNFYLKSDEYRFDSITEAVRSLADYDRQFDTDGDFAIARRKILLLMERYQSDISLSELCALYAREYLGSD